MPTSQAVWWEPRGADPENKFCEFNYSAQMWSRLLCIQGNWARLPGGGSRQTGQTDQTSWDALQRGCLNLKNWGNKMSCSWPELYRIYSSTPPAPVYSGYISSVLVTTLPFVLPMRAFVTLLAHWSSGNLKKKKSIHPSEVTRTVPDTLSLHSGSFWWCASSGILSILLWLMKMSGRLLQIGMTKQLLCHPQRAANKKVLLEEGRTLSEEFERWITQPSPGVCSYRQRWISKRYGVKSGKELRAPPGRKRERHQDGKGRRGTRKRTQDPCSSLLACSFFLRSVFRGDAVNGRTQELPSPSVLQISP